MQKISKDNYRQEDRTESEDNDGVQTYIGISENRFTEVHLSKEKLLEQIFTPTNLNRAFKQVVSNKGSSGVDGMSTTELQIWIRANKEELLTSLNKGTYRPNPVLRVEIPKDNGKRRSLGIPTVIDRLIQQAISQELTKKYDRKFSLHSYGFRPGRSAHHALQRAESIIKRGYKYAVDIDLEKFFDTVNQSKLIEIMFQEIKDGRVISLIHKYLKAGISIHGEVERSETGVPQGSPLSPLLSNIMLDKLDKELENQGHPFVRYADDVIIFCRSARSAERTKASIIRFIERHLYLRVNREKTKSGKVYGMKFLGYSFYPNKDKCGLFVHPKSKEKLKTKLKELTSRSDGKGHESRKRRLEQFIQGWVEYFKLADMKSFLEKLDSWLRRRIRMCIWKSWKKLKTRYKKLVEYGIEECTAWMWANTRKGYWHTAGSQILKVSITNTNLREEGYVFLSDVYAKVHRK
jgi:group II intron reverse transcriptase/maturase